MMSCQLKVFEEAGPYTLRELGIHLSFPFINLFLVTTFLRNSHGMHFGSYGIFFPNTP